ncbi:hypothetical protein X777_10250 [Ooceraea biroi]|uniref:Uncharacterized protein n=1 Tax=Ooceraea biroi TaxID=2015173 RepID=A0A026W5A9_OOCBI|nr:hypothetical protein X777_10250 [Ooceraea biroi]
MRNTHLWADENARAYQIRNFHRFSVNLWAIRNARATERSVVCTVSIKRLAGLLENVPLEQREQRVCCSSMTEHCWICPFRRASR